MSITIGKLLFTCKSGTFFPLANLSSQNGFTLLPLQFRKEEHPFPDNLEQVLMLSQSEFTFSNEQIPSIF